MRYSQKRLAVAFAVLVAVALLPVLFLGCGKPGTREVWEANAKPRVLTSIVPLHCFAAQVAGDDAQVRCLLTSRGPHDYQSTPHDAKLLASADLFIVNGFGLEDFLNSLVKSSGNNQLKIIRTADRIATEDEKNIIQASGEPHYHGDKLVTHTGNDPHVWLGIEQAKLQVAAICDALVEHDPSHAENYRNRAEKYKQKLDDLKKKYKDLRVPGGLVTFHDSFRYFGQSFGVKIEGTIRDLSGGEIPPAKLNAQAIEFRKKGVKLISVEPQYPRRVAENLAREIGGDVRIVELDPLETGPASAGRNYYVDPDWYLTKMAENLENLRQAAK